MQFVLPLLKAELRRDANSMLAALQEKHPLPQPECVILSCPAMVPLISLSEEDIPRVIKSFPNGSGGGLDG